MHRPYRSIVDCEHLEELIDCEWQYDAMLPLMQMPFQRTDGAVESEPER
jgi:hypothetical protein